MKTAFYFLYWLFSSMAPYFPGHFQPCKIHDSMPGAKESGLIHPALVNRFYQINGRQLFWYTNGEESYRMRCALKNSIDSSETAGLDKHKYHYNELIKATEKDLVPVDSVRIKLLDRLFTDAAIAWCKDMYQGINTGAGISYDGISGKYAVADDNRVLTGLVASKSATALLQYLQSLKPHQSEYTLLTTALQQQLQKRAGPAALRMTNALNIFRWMHHFNFDKWVVVNIASATLRYYEHDSLKLKFKVVVGKPSTKTPRFSAYCNQLILYPYWNVPHTIAVKEYLPLFKRYPFLVDSLEMQVLDKTGKLVDRHQLKWNGFSREWFPYTIRQSTGCNNALGVLKFNLTSPYDVYMHDTNVKSAFSSVSRYYSHGCIRLEKPFDLAAVLLPGGIDTSFLQACYKQQLPVILNLYNPVPVFVIYSTVETDETGSLRFFRDVYKLGK